MVESSPKKESLKHLAGWLVAVLLPPAVYAAGLASSFTVEAAIFAAILSAVVALWVFSLVPEFVPPLLAVVATLFVGLAPPEVALAGFASPSLLLLLGVFALSAVISGSGLSYRVMLWLLLKLPDRSFWHRFTLLVGGYFLSPIMPSANSRLSLLQPLFRDMADGLHLPLRGPAITGLLAATFSGALLMSPMMATSKSSNIAAINFLPPQVQEEFLGTFWLVAAGVAAATMTLVHFFAVYRMFPEPGGNYLPREHLQRQQSELGPWKNMERVAAVMFVFFLGGSMTVSWHHVPAAWIAGFVLVGLLVSGVLTRGEFQKQIDWPMIFFLLGVDSLMKVMHHLGLVDDLARATAGIYGFIGGDISRFILAALATTVLLRLVLPVTAGMLTSAVILLPVSAAEGIHPWVCIFLTAVFSDIWLAGYQGTNGFLQLRSSGLMDLVNEPAFRRYNMVMNIARVAAVFASLPWWRWLGLL
ncbi:MAG: SLC13 family permease [Chthoniobacterales bacterium]|nr:SLC13 family permease [Chthoniobacterales bacterium]